ESQMRALTRRRLLSSAVFGAASVAVLAACSTPAAPTQAPAATKPAEKPTTAPAAAGGATPAPAAGAAGAPAAGGKDPRVVSIATEGLQIFSGKELALKLDDYAKNDKGAIQEYFSDVAPSLVESMMYEGSLYSLPVNFNAANMFINVEALQKAGINLPADDWTANDFREIARKVIAKKDATGQPETFGYAWTNRHWGGYIPWVFVNGANLLTEERAPGGEWLWSAFYPNDAAAKGRGGGWRWNQSRSEERRVGKEGRSRRSPEQ